MPDIQSLIEALQSESPNIRYDACEQLRVLPSISRDAIDALILVTNDENTDVADAARRAFAMHSHMLSKSTQIDELENLITSLETRRNSLENPVSNNTVPAMAIGVFFVIFCCISQIAGMINFIGPTLSEQPGMLISIFLVAAILTIPAVMYLNDKRKEKNKETVVHMNDEIQVLKDKIQEIKQTKPA